MRGFVKFKILEGVFWILNCVKTLFSVIFIYYFYTFPAQGTKRTIDLRFQIEKN